MKKALFLLAVAAVFAACGKGTDTPTVSDTETPADQVEVVESATTETPAETPANN